VKRKRRGPDRGTPEQQLRRAVLAGGGDPRLTEYPLGLLLAREFINDEQHNAGLHYAGLYRACIGGGKLRQPVGPRDMSPEADLAVQGRFEEATGALLDAGKRAKAQVDNVAVFEFFPQWITGWRLGVDYRDPDDDRGNLLLGLTALAQWREKGKKDPPERVDPTLGVC